MKQKIQFQKSTWYVILGVPEHTYSINIDGTPRTWERGKKWRFWWQHIIMIRRMGWKITNYERNWRSREKYIRYAWKYRDIFQSFSIKGYFNTTIRVCGILGCHQLCSSNCLYKEWKRENSKWQMKIERGKWWKSRRFIFVFLWFHGQKHNSLDNDFKRFPHW
jgi:hypothetical protein